MATDSSFQVLIPGRPVCLKELYSQRIGKFLGASLYPTGVKTVETHIALTNIHVKRSTAHQDRVSLFNIHPSLSLSVLSGLVNVSGTGDYLLANKLHTAEETYSISLELHLTEKRLSITDMGVDPFPAADERYIRAKKAMHFVSSITFGGFLIANFVARKSENFKDKKFAGVTKGLLTKFVDIGLRGTMDKEIKDELQTIEESFGFFLYGDMVLDEVPLNVQDLLKTFRTAPQLIRENDEVAIFATLQPTPSDLGGSFIPRSLAGLLFGPFSNLADLRSRFSALQENSYNVADTAPRLAQQTAVICRTYTKEHNTLRNQLVAFVEDRRGRETRAATSLRNATTKLRDKYLKDTDKGKETSRRYPSTLRGLENHVSSTKHFPIAIDDFCQSLSAKEDSSRGGVRHQVHGSSADDFMHTLVVQRKVPLFVTAPLSGNPTFSPPSHLQEHASFLLKHARYFADSDHPPYLMYVEDMGDLKNGFVNGQALYSLQDPSLSICRLDPNSGVTWGLPGNDQARSERTLTQTHLQGHRSWLSTALSCCSCLGTRTNHDPVIDTPDGSQSTTPLITTTMTTSHLAATSTTTLPSNAADINRAILELEFRSLEARLSTAEDHHVVALANLAEGWELCDGGAG